MKIQTRRRIYLREAAVMLILARLAVRFMPRGRLFAWANRPPRQIRRFAAHEAEWVTWAVKNIAAHPWINADCLPQALAAHAMLRRRGIASRLCVGVARLEGALTAHAWVEVGQGALAGASEAAAYTRLAEFGTASR
jgi:transglutaminase-like putative cysteine protease